MKLLILAFLAAASLFGQAQQVRWSATTGVVAQSGAAYTATIQQPATNQSPIYLDQVIVYCSVACVVTQTAFGSGATTTVGTIQPLMPSPPNTQISAKFFTASNVGTGTQQGGPFTMLAGQNQPFDLSAIIIPTGGINANYSFTVNAITGNSSITFYGHSNQ